MVADMPDFAYINNYAGSSPGLVMPTRLLACL